MSDDIKGNQTQTFLDATFSALAPENAEETESLLSSKISERDMVTALHFGGRADVNLAVRYFLLRISCAIYLKRAGMTLRLITTLLAANESGGNFEAFATLTQVLDICEATSWKEGLTQLGSDLRDLAESFISDDDMLCRINERLGI